MTVSAALAGRRGTGAGGPVHVVLPGDVDDPARPSGGNTYGLRVLRGLPSTGRAVRAHRVDGAWPRPDDAGRRALGRCLAAVPSGADVLLDGLVACGVPEVVVPHAAQLRLTVLVHLPLADEVGAPAELAVRERAVLRAAHAVVATSPHAARRVRELHGVDARVVTPGTDAAPAAPTGEAGTRLLCVGSVTPTKGQDVLVEALAAVANRAWRCTLVGPLVRDPAHVALVRGLVERHGLDGRVQVAGPRTGAALDAAYADADLLVVPSRHETYGMVVTEALARGLPVLAAGVGGLPETLREAGAATAQAPLPGLLVAPAQDMAGALAAALRRWLDEPALRADARAAAAARRPHLDGWDVTAQRLAQVLA